MQLCCSKPLFQPNYQRKYIGIVCARSKSSPKTSKEKQNILKRESINTKKPKGFEPSRGKAISIATSQKLQQRSIRKILEQQDVAWLVNFFTGQTAKKQKETFKIPKDILAAAQILYDSQEYQAAFQAYSTAFEIIAQKYNIFFAFLQLTKINADLNFKSVHSLKFACSLLSNTQKNEAFTNSQRIQALYSSKVINFWGLFDEIKLGNGKKYPKTLQQFLCLTNDELTSSPPIRLTVDHNISKRPIRDAIKLVENGDKENAMGILLSLIYEKTELAKTILKLRAETSLKVGDPAGAAFDITTYLVLQPKEYDAAEITLFRAQCLRNMGLFRRALQVIQQEKFHQNSLMLQNEANQLEKLIKAEENLRPTWFHSLGVAIISKLEQFLLLDQTHIELIQHGQELDKLPRTVRQIYADSRLQDYHKQIVMKTNLPAQSNKEKCLQYLEAGISHARTQAKLLEIFKDSPWCAEENYKRKVMNRRSWFQKWRKNAKLGDVNPLSAKALSRSNSSNFSYLWQKPMNLVQGSTHAAINYRDLSFLMHAEYAGNAGDGAVYVVAIDQSLYSSTLSQVIYQMMLDNAPVEAIFQVWYSSGWSEQTMKHFREAVTQLLQNQLEQNSPKQGILQILLSKVPLKPCVLDLLYVWLSVPLRSLKDSFDEWIKLHPSVWYGAEFQRKQDLVAVASYSLSGRLLDCEYASVVMWQSFPLQDKSPLDQRIMRQIYENEINLDLKSDTNVMDFTIDMLLHKIHGLKQKIINGEIKIDFMVGEVQPRKKFNFFVNRENEKSVLEKIKEIRPQSISWADTVDYFDMNQFHDMLKFCSQGGKTIHYVSSMQWNKDVKGTFCLDYSVDEQLKIYQNILQKQEIDHSSLIYWPPIINPEKLLDYYLKKKYYKGWLQVFFEKGGVKADDVLFADISPFACSALMQGMLSLCYKYN